MRMKAQSDKWHDSNKNNKTSSNYLTSNLITSLGDRGKRSINTLNPYSMEQAFKIWEFLQWSSKNGRLTRANPMAKKADEPIR